MRLGRPAIILLTSFLIFLILAIHTVYSLLTLLFEDGGSDVISHVEIPAPNSEFLNPDSDLNLGDNPDNSNEDDPSSPLQPPASSAPLRTHRPQLIPKIIHQTYINTSIPEVWQQAQQSCIDLHEDYEYKLWTDEGSAAFIATEYPWFLETFVGYTYPIQRADAIRYFVLAHYGGVYIDLDDVCLLRSLLPLPLCPVVLLKERSNNLLARRPSANSVFQLQGCNRRLDPLLAYPAWTRRTVPTGISNDAMAAIPQHPFFLHVTSSLQKYDRSWFLPYITIMSSTGPLFLSLMWEQYMASPSNIDSGRLRILSQDDYRGHSWSFFYYNVGSSWHAWDSKLIFWMGRHWLLITTMGFVCAGMLGLAVWWAWRAIFEVRKSLGLAIVGGASNSGGGSNSNHNGIGPSSGLGFLAQLLRGGKGRRRKGDYELLERYES
ncbi:hypothetical protein MMC25_001250 [Agyrium rufum]|nr:hypothetical protein [Agyrium rufum]